MSRSLFSCFSTGKRSKRKYRHPTSSLPERSKKPQNGKVEINSTDGDERGLVECNGTNNQVDNQNKQKKVSESRHKKSRSAIKSIKYQPTIDSESDVLAEGDNHHDEASSLRKEKSEKTTTTTDEQPHKELYRRHSSLCEVTVSLADSSPESEHKRLREVTPKVNKHDEEEEEEESLLGRLHKLLPWNDHEKKQPEDSLSEKQPCCFTTQLSTLSVSDAGAGGSTSTSPLLRPRSKTLDPTDTASGARRHSFSHIKPTSSDSGFKFFQTESSDKADGFQHDLRLKQAREKYICGRAIEHNRSSSNSLEKSKSISRSGSRSSSRNNSSKHLKPVDESHNTPSHERTVRSFGHLDQLKQKLMERGEKVGFLEDRSESMRYTTENLSKSAHLLAEKYKNKKWYEL